MSKIKRTLITGETSVVIDCNGVKYPASVTLKSSDATRKIEFSTNDGLEYFTPQIDITTATMRVVAVNAPITKIRVTGVVGDVLAVAY